MIVTVAAAGCGSAPSGMPDDFGGTVTYRNGTVPPPHHYEWRVDVDGTSVTVTWLPGYDEAVAPWTETVTVTPERRTRFHEDVRGRLDFEDAEDGGVVGGPTGSFELVADGRTYSSGDLGTSEDGQDALDDVRSAATALVPGEVWSSFEDKQEQWGER